ncbi:MAG: flavodoxin family protein [Aquificaceae bacterium]|nr:MAG: flavodoxin family protein [Aquificaceae bacterium]
MNTLIVYTHPNPTSFNHAILDNISEGLKKAGHDVRIKDLYKENFDPVLHAEDLAKLQTGDIPERIGKQQEDLLWAEGLVFIYPLWWFDRPAMLKGWFDLVLTNGLAFEYSDKGVRGLLKHKKALVIITAGGSKQYFIDTDALQLIHRPVTDGTLSFCGINDVTHRIYYDVANLSDDERADILKESAILGETFAD